MDIVETKESIEEILVDIHVLDALIGDGDFSWGDGSLSDLDEVRSEIVEVCGDVPTVVHVREDDVHDAEHTQHRAHDSHE
jgi:hypothetical protein